MNKFYRKLKFHIIYNYKNKLVKIPTLFCFVYFRITVTKMCAAAVHLVFILAFNHLSFLVFKIGALAKTKPINKTIIRHQLRLFAQSEKRARVTLAFVNLKIDLAI